MKTNKLALLILSLGFVLVSCDPNNEKIQTIIDFEDVTLGENGLSSDTSFISSGFTFYGDPNKFWLGGIVCSSQTDTVTTGFTNQYSCIGASGALTSTKFGVLYQPGYIKSEADNNGDFHIKSIMINNTTYAYKEVKNGSAFSKKFESGDWFKLTISGYYAKSETAKVDIYLADFRDGKSFIMKNWQKVDVSKLGKVDSISFSLSSTDNGDWGMNTPAYACIDNIEYEQEIIK